MNAAVCRECGHSMGLHRDDLCLLCRCGVEDLSIPRDLAEELLALLHDLAGHERVTQGEVSPGVVRCADALRAVLSHERPEE